jgi:peptidyl-prolyl cis-trans isomerase A (cyclophilin A)
MNKKIYYFLSLIILTVFYSCNEKYPDIPDGIYAEFVTNKGTMVAKLFHEKTPVTVANFVALAEGNHPLVKEEFKKKKYYNGITFHRVMDNFMIQGGDPTASGLGDAGYKFEDEFHPDLKHNKPGILSMANSGPNTNGSQFFITEKETPWLDNRHSIFGELVLGQDIQDSISNVKVGLKDKPVEDVVITELNIIRKGKEAKNFDAPKVFEEELPKIKERQQKLAEEQKKKAEEKANAAKKAFLESNKDLKGRRKEFDTGLAMVYTYESGGAKPKSTDRVNIECAGYLENGNLFWTTNKELATEKGKYDENQDKAGFYKPLDMPYNETATLIAGFKEAMLNMNVGDKARVFIPYYLGYGERGRAPVIPPSANLIFDIELLGIVE